MAAHNDGPTMEDVLDYTQAVEAMYGLPIIIQLRPSEKGCKGRWTVVAVAYVEGPEGTREMLLEKMVTYPSSSFKTFPGACLNAAMSLEQQLQGYYWLQQMQGV